MIVIGGSASRQLSESLARELSVPVAKTGIKRFPDDEVYVRVEDDLSGQDAVIVQTAFPDRNIVELFLLQDAARQAGAAKVTTVIPYYGYSRQDKLFNPGEALSAWNLASHFELFSDRVITVDLHAPKVLEAFKKQNIHISGMPAIARHLEQHNVDAVISPDKGAVARAGEVAKILGTSFDYLEKTRIDGQTVAMKPKSLDVSGKVVAIVDDIISTGGTIITAAGQLKAQGAEKIIAACTHGLFANNSLPRLKDSLDVVFATDTLEGEASEVSVAPEIAKALRE